MRFAFALLSTLVLAAAAEKRPLEFAGIIEQREPFSPRISPDGRAVAFLVRQSSLADNSTKLSLWLAGDGATPRKLIEENFIGSLEWMPDGLALTATLPRPGRAALWRIPLNGDTPQPLFEHASRPSLYAWAPDGKRLLFAATEDPPPEQRAAMDRTGIVYDETIHGIRSFTQRNWTPPGAQHLWIWDAGSREARRVGVNLSEVKRVSQMLWSPGGDRVALEYTPDGAQGFEQVTHIGILVIDRATGTATSFTPVVTTPLANRGPAWRPDGKALVFTSTYDTERVYSIRSRIMIADLSTTRASEVKSERSWVFLSKVRFDATGANLLIEYDDQSTSALYRMPATGGEAKPAVPGSAYLSDFHFSRDGRRAACVRQSFTEPPEIARADLESGEAEALTRLNPQFDSVSLQPGQQRRWRNRFGHESNGFLILPPSYRRGERVPLLVIQYNFANKFTTQAQWIPNYPAQHFAAAGFAVLLHNYPRELGWKSGDFEAAALSQAYNPLTSLETAVKSLVDEGIADPARKGIMGWSFGAWLAEMAVTQSDLFQAASAGEGGLNNAGQYWVTGSAAMQQYLDAFFGGPPFGPALKNYQRLAPAMNADKMNVPLLREYGPDVGVQSLEFYMALRRLGKPVEQVIYPGAPHVFSLPSHRLASMQRNLDWFRFWLQKYEDPDPAKKPQYERWRRLLSARGKR